VQEAIERLMAHRTVFVIAHRPHARAARRLHRRAGGKDASWSGAVTTILLAADGLYRRLYNLQFRT